MVRGLASSQAQDGSALGTSEIRTIVQNLPQSRPSPSLFFYSSYSSRSPYISSLQAFNCHPRSLDNKLCDTIYARSRRLQHRRVANEATRHLGAETTRVGDIRVEKALSSTTKARLALLAIAPEPAVGTAIDARSDTSTSTTAKFGILTRNVLSF